MVSGLANDLPILKSKLNETLREVSKRKTLDLWIMKLL